MSTERHRVALVVNSLALAGAERMTVDLACGLAARDWDVHVLVVRDGPLRAQLEATGVPVHVTGAEFDWRWPVIVTRMTRLLRQLEPQIVHTNLIGSDVVGGIAARLAGVPVVMSTQHDSYARPAVFGWYRRWAAQRTDAVVAVSPGLLEYCNTVLHMERERVHVIENGVDVDRFTESVSEQRRPPTFGAVGSLIPVKGHTTLVRAFASVHDSEPGARLIIAGDGPERPVLAALIETLELPDAVELKGVVADMPEYLSHVDIFVQPSLQEALPVAVLEAMAARKPVIASELPTLRMLLGEGPDAAGVLVSANDPDALAAAMNGLVETPEQARELGQAGYRAVLAKYSLASMVERYESVYLEVLDAKSRG
ncbi:MAG: glycosyltransferase [Actinobacteria bacterium]|nr:glycosyltransferase [Actinomycetota bacterium]MCG2807160.1 glycosyltransferase [Coriobacteriia bacterium]